MEITVRKPLRLWPGVVIVILQCVVGFGVPVILSDAGLIGMLAGPVATLAVLLWWVFFSRAPWSERLGAVAVVIVAMFATRRILDASIATGAQGVLFPFLALSFLGAGFVVWAVATSRLPNGVRRATMVATILLACGVWALVRTGGFTASTFHNDLHWRWTKTPEERLLAQSGKAPGALPAARSAGEAPEPKELPQAPAAKIVEKKLVANVAERLTSLTPDTVAEWSGFRGPHRDDIIFGVRIKTNWTASPPVALWRRPIGPGWSSFSVSGGLLYTQEQRGPDEVVACYKLTTGEPVWAHRDPTRFWESNGGPGPRATPTLQDGRVYTFGATGIVNALDAGDGTVLWSRNAGSDTGMKVPGWGFASSPLVVGDMVVVAASGKLVAYDIASGAPRWSGPNGGDSYSSPHLATIGGVPQILLMSAAGATSVAPDGKLLWKYAWPSDTRIMQPTVTADGDLLITAGDAMGGVGMRRIAVAQGSAGWTTEERWTSSGLKPSFNDSVVHNGYVFGFDGGILACIDVKDGVRKWKGGRYGAGQLILLNDQDLLVVISEEGELALVQAAPDQFKELARFPALEGKTWNHLVLAGDRLLVRNGSEMVAFRLSLDGV
jgi:outer membrane protein assembly factor BamB